MNRLKSWFSLRMRSLKFWWQRRTRGWSDDELWNLDVTFAQFMLPRVKAFRDGHADLGHPECLNSVEGWQAILFDIEQALAIMASDRNFLPNSDEDLKIQRGMELFSQYVRGMWD